MLRQCKRILASAPRPKMCLQFHSHRSAASLIPYSMRARLMSTSPHFNRTGETNSGSNHMYLSSEYDAENPASHNVYRYPIDFQSSCADVQFIQEGGYMEISDNDRERYLPEGFSGELADEVKDTERNAWMVREPSKLLCR